MSNKLGNVLRIAAIVMVAMTGVFNLLGGVGTSCVAWNADKYGKAFAMFVPYMMVYQILVYVILIVALAGVVASYALLRRDGWAFRGSLISLAVSVIIAGIQMYYTSSLKGISFFQTPPTSMRFYISVLSLIFLLVLMLPGLRKRVDFTSPWPKRNSKSSAGGLTAIIASIIILTTPIWAGESHMLDGYNLVNVLQVPLMLVGGLTLASGIGLLVSSTLGITREQIASFFRRERNITPVDSIQR